MSNRVQNPYEIFTDVDGTPLEGGYIYIGEEGLNPLSNPQQAYWDADLTIPASNIRTSGGYPVYQGSPGRLYVADPYSITVRNSRENVVFSSITPPVDLFEAIQCSSVTVTDSTGSVSITGNDINFSEDDVNYIWANTIDGYIAIGTNGRTKDPTEANIVLETDQSVTFPGNASVEGAFTTDTINAAVIEGETSGDPMTFREGSGGALQVKVIEIGSWNMKATSSVTIAHGVPDITNIRSVEVLIQDDFSSELYPISHNTGSDSAGHFSVTTDNVVLVRAASVFFDLITRDYGSTSVNRGWVTITYEV